MVSTLRWLMVLLLAGAAFHDASATPARRLHTGITGVITSGGLDNPQYVLSHAGVQALVFEAVSGPVSEDRARSLLEGTPVAVSDLRRLGILERNDGRLQLSYLVLTRQDQRSMHQAAERFGPSLADAFASEAAEFDALLAQYPNSSLRKDLLFTLVAGILMNWEGLAVSTELGYRVSPRTWPNGDRYLFWSKETGEARDSRGLFLGSHTAPGGAMAFSTFGDGPSIPRIRSLPDVFAGPLEEGLAAYRDHPSLHAAVRGNLRSYVLDALSDAGTLMQALAREPKSRKDLATNTGLAEAKLSATLDLLEAIGYVRQEQGGYVASVVILTAEDAAWVRTTLELGRDILRRWLTAHYDAIRTELAALSPMRQGLPFELAFSEVWHDIFGVAGRELAKRGFYTDPNAEGAAFRGFIPLVWDVRLRQEGWPL